MHGCTVYPVRAGESLCIGGLRFHEGLTQTCLENRGKTVGKLSEEAMELLCSPV